MNKSPNTAAPNDKTTELVDSVGSAVESFAQRFQRKLKEKESEVDATQRATEARHALMLQAMNTIRKALAETVKINLGARFSLAVDISDWEGWPRIQVKLVDAVAPSHSAFVLAIIAHDRQEMGCINMTLNSEKLLAQAFLKDPEEFKRLPLMLKRAIREYRDTGAPYVLNPPDPRQVFEAHSKALHMDDEPETSADSELSEVDVFTEESYGDSNIVTSGDVSPVDA